MLNKPRMVFKGFTALIICLFLAGCWDRTELNKIGITSATAIDWDQDHWTVSYQLVIPQSISSQNAGGGSNRQAPVMVFSTTGDSIQSANQHASLEMPRSLFFAHNRVVIIGEEAARKGIVQMLDIYLRSSSARETVSVFVTRETGRKILEQLVPMEKIPGSSLQNMLLNEDKQGSSLKQVMIYQLAMGMGGDSGYTAIPEVFIAGKEGKSTSIDAMKSTVFDSKLKMGRLGIFKKDKLIGWMSNQEAYGINWITNHVNQSLLIFGCTPGDKQRQAAVRVYQAKTHLTPVRINGGWVMKADVRASSQLIENGCGIDVTKPEGIHAMEKLINQEMDSIMQTALQKAKDMKADVLDFGGHIHRKDPKYWKQFSGDWDNQFAQIPMETSIQINIKRLGMSTKPFVNLINGKDE
ncbi:Ger(x)C family spore germination protein [Paenibacillus sp. SI8]|uniref:Ger(x)C family spore germination protein n=1 Tax=unclassified Paenibacillus TaxID=185978 RepID=UPI003467AA1E